MAKIKEIEGGNDAEHCRKLAAMEKRNRELEGIVEDSKARLKEDREELDGAIWALRRMAGMPLDQPLLDQSDDEEG